MLSRETDVKKNIFKTGIDIELEVSIFVFTYGLYTEYVLYDNLLDYSNEGVWPFYDDQTIHAFITSMVKDVEKLIYIFRVETAEMFLKRIFFDKNFVENKRYISHIPSARYLADRIPYGVVANIKKVYK